MTKTDFIAATPQVILIGTAGWSVPGALASEFPGTGTHLQRYSCGLSCTEINSSFHRSHRVEVYRRWAESTPTAFRFAAKLPRSITHDGRLRSARDQVTKFAAEVAGLGDRLNVLVVQLPPSLEFEARIAKSFFRMVREAIDVSVVCEPRHHSWFSPAADGVLVQMRVGRVAVDPVRCSAGAVPGGWLGHGSDGVGATVYYRWHGSPRMYWSQYGDAWLDARVKELSRWPDGTACWCVFDNTAAGAATANARTFQRKILESGS